MRKIFFIFCVLFGCNGLPVEVSHEPRITIVNIYGNDAIDATIEYSVEGELSETYLLVDEHRIEVAGKDGVYMGIFPARAKARMIVAILKGKTIYKSF